MLSVDMVPRQDQDELNKKRTHSMPAARRTHCLRADRFQKRLGTYRRLQDLSSYTALTVDHIRHCKQAQAWHTHWNLPSMKGVTVHSVERCELSSSSS